MLTVATFHYMNHPVRVVETDGKIYFVIRDICDIIKISNPNNALSKYTNNVPLYNRILTPGGLQIVRLVSEADVDLLLRGYNTRPAFLMHIWLLSSVYPILDKPADKRKISYRLFTRKADKKGKHHADR